MPIPSNLFVELDKVVDEIIYFILQFQLYFEAGGIYFASNEKLSAHLQSTRNDVILKKELYKRFK